VGRVLGTVLVLAALMLGGCPGGAATNPLEQGEKEDVERAVEDTPDGERIQKEVSVPADVPAYTLTKNEAGAIQGFVIRDVSATTDATSEEDLEAVALELWAETEEDILAVAFYPDKPTADVSGTAQAFLSVGPPVPSSPHSTRTPRRRTSRAR